MNNFYPKNKDFFCIYIFLDVNVLNNLKKGKGMSIINNEMIKLCISDYENFKNIANGFLFNLSDELTYIYSLDDKIRNLSIFSWVHHSSNQKNIDNLWKDLKTLSSTEVESLMLNMIRTSVDTINVKNLKLSITKYKEVFNDNLDSIEKELLNNINKIKNTKQICQLLEKEIISKPPESIIDLMNQNQDVDLLNVLMENYNIHNDSRSLFVAVRNLYISKNVYSDGQESTLSLYNDNNLDRLSWVVLLINKGFNRKCNQSNDLLLQVNKERGHLYYDRYINEFINNEITFEIVKLKENEDILNLFVQDKEYFNDFIPISNLWDKMLLIENMQSDNKQKDKKRL